MVLMKKEAIGKKGAELSLNTIIVWVLGAILLVVVVYFFLTGTGRTSGSISDIFKASTAGVSRDLAIEACQQRCDSIKGYSKATAENSAFCKSPFKIDDDGDGVSEEYIADPETGKRAAVKFYCRGPSDRSKGRDSLKMPCTLQSGEELSCIP